MFLLFVKSKLSLQLSRSLFSESDQLFKYLNLFFLIRLMKRSLIIMSITSDLLRRVNKMSNEKFNNFVVQYKFDDMNQNNDSDVSSLTSGSCYIRYD